MFAKEVMPEFQGAPVA